LPTHGFCPPTDPNDPAEEMTMLDSETRFWQRFLPNQYGSHTEVNRVSESYHRTLYDLISRVSGFDKPEEAFKIEHSPRFSLEQMGSNPVSLAFLQFIIRLSGARNLLEIGTFIGASSMAFAQALPPDGRVTTIEKFDEFAALARSNIADNGLSDRIQVIEGDAMKLTGELREISPFDFIFLDGNKERYLDYFETLWPILAPGGLFVVDDCCFGGDALRENPETEKGQGVRALLDHVAERRDFDRFLLPLGNGILLLSRH
jgi:predicted O-methyltransferase YrrM